MLQWASFPTSSGSANWYLSQGRRFSLRLPCRRNSSASPIPFCIIRCVLKSRKPATTAANITQLLVATGRDPHEKRQTLRRLIRSATSFKNAIVFCNRKREVANLHRSLLRHKFNAAALHGDMDQSARTAALKSYRKGEVTVLVASDVAARGLDIPAVSHIFNFDVPHHADDYVHRIGRTGRAGLSGTAITIVAPLDSKAVSAIERLISQSIAWLDKPAVSEATESSSPRDPHDQRPGARAPPRAKSRTRPGAPQAKKNAPVPKAPPYQPAQGKRPRRAARHYCFDQYQ